MKQYKNRTIVRYSPALPKSLFVRKCFCKHEWGVTEKHENDEQVTWIRDSYQEFCTKCGKLGKVIGIKYEWDYWSNPF